MAARRKRSTFRRRNAGRQYAPVVLGRAAADERRMALVGRLVAAFRGEEWFK